MHGPGAFHSLQRGSAAIAGLSDDYPFSEREVFDLPEYPKLHFVEHRYAGDPTNWWIPNAACAAAMLRSAGFEIVSHPETEVYVCRRAEFTNRLSVDETLLVEGLKASRATDGGESVAN